MRKKPLCARFFAKRLLLFSFSFFFQLYSLSHLYRTMHGTSALNMRAKRNLIYAFHTGVFPVLYCLQDQSISFIGPENAVLLAGRAVLDSGTAVNQDLRIAEDFIGDIDAVVFREVAHNE